MSYPPSTKPYHTILPQTTIPYTGPKEWARERELVLKVLSNAECIFSFLSDSDSSDSDSSDSDSRASQSSNSDSNNSSDSDMQWGLSSEQL